MSEKFQPINPFNKENTANSDSWETSGRGQGLGKNAEAGQIAEAEAKKIAAQEKQQILAAKDAEESRKAIEEINKRIAAMDNTGSQDGQIAEAFQDLDVDETVEAGISEMTDAEVEMQKTEEEEQKKIVNKKSDEETRLDQFNRAKVATDTYLKDYGNEKNQKTG